MTDENTTHFGFKKVAESEKAGLVSDVFASVAERYDIMNDLMSFGLHRLWKRMTISASGARAGGNILDVASGTGDLAYEFSKIVGDHGKVVMTDINPHMLKVGQDKLIDKGIIKNIAAVLADAENLPFANNHFDCVTIAFGLRNVTNKQKALQSMYQVLKPGGKLLILEFSQPSSRLLNKIYELYSFNIIPKMGELVTKDSQSYQYLVESIRMHPNQKTLKNMMEQAGFEEVTYQNMTGGVVALHIGYKY